MPKAKGIFLTGTADGISFEKAFEDAIKKAPPTMGDIPQRFIFKEFHVDTGGFVGRPMSHIKVKCIDVK
jgi:hypothetical protein